METFFAGASVNTEEDLPERALVAVAMGLVQSNKMNPWGLHGLAHWWRVRHNGLLIAEAMGAIPRVVRLFAIFHDSQRLDDGWDKEHGPRAAAWLDRVRHEGESLTSICPCDTTRALIRALPTDEFDALHMACDQHTSAKMHDNATVATCFVADRLDLSWVGYRPDPRLMPAPTALLDDAFIEDAIAREHAGLAWAGGGAITAVWGVSAS
jgi:uncharacterized protein